MKKQKRSWNCLWKYSFIILVLVCWSAALGQTVHDKYFRDRAVPAFQNQTLPQEETQNAFQNLPDRVSDTEQDFSQSMSYRRSNAKQDFSQSMSHKTKPLSEAELIFQSQKSQTWEIAEFPDHLTRDSAFSYCQSLIQSFSESGENAVSAASLISSGSSSGYSDFYFSCPFLTEKFSLTPYDSSKSNLQIVLTWNKDGSCRHVYLGFPFIEYGF